MGLCPDLDALMRQNHALLDDRACMVLMDPPNKDREIHVRTAPHYSNAADVSCLIESIDGKVNAYSGASYPPLSQSLWRHKDPIGLQLNSGSRNIVRSNFFRVPTGRLPGIIYQYSVSIFK